MAQGYWTIRREQRSGTLGKRRRSRRNINLFHRSMELINNFFIFLTVVKIQLDLHLVSWPRRFALEPTTYRSMRHKVAPAPLRFAFYLTQHLVAPPRSAYHVSWYYILCPRSAAHTTCSGLRPTISCGQGSAYLLHLAPPSGGTISCAIDHGHLLYLGGSAPRYYILCCIFATYYI